MVLSLSLLLLAILFAFVVSQSPHAIGLFIFIEFFLPSEILIASTLSLTVSRVAFLLFAVYAIRKNYGIKLKKYPIPIWLIFILYALLLFQSYINTISTDLEVQNPMYFMFTVAAPNLFVPGLLVFYSISTKNDFLVAIKWMVLLCLIWFGYGLYEFLFKQNYFIDQLIKQFPTRTSSVVKGYFYNNNSNSIRFGSSVRIQGTVWHPIGFGGRINLVLGVILLCNSIFDLKREKLLQLFLNVSIAAALICSLLTFSRSVWIFALLQYLLYRYHRSKNKKIIIYLLSFVGLAAFYFFGSLFIDTFFSNVEGSSIDMRLKQAESVLTLLGDKFMFGLGQNFDTTYLAKYGTTTDAYGFESFLFVVLLDSGLAGLVFYVVFFTYILRCKFSNIYVQNATRYLSISYLAFILLTGEMQTLWIYWLSINVVFALDTVLDPKKMIKPSQIPKTTLNVVR